ncbi:hypothetical protein P691DRAFT_806603 [Macrolepiota fuliginosa MF-IS2]|uniref:Uncharacterized protein n=1 Tax=Macrolepiota fuliginosa MF-IS2 TaxID=1400762 RepID=A0A9P5X7M2_9AGAR|nr:hypothetical protein P691DRAFT_806603 [Macrolepiota fuliginosa MF-IS2]
MDPSDNGLSHLDLLHFERHENREYPNILLGSGMQPAYDPVHGFLYGIPPGYHPPPSYPSGPAMDPAYGPIVEGCAPATSVIVVPSYSQVVDPSSDESIPGPRRRPPRAAKRNNPHPILTKSLDICISTSCGTASFGMDMGPR